MTSEFRLSDRLLLMIDMIDRIHRQLDGVTAFQFGEDSDLIVHEYRKVAPARIWDTAEDLAGLRSVLMDEQKRLESE